jgi:Tfp pilus assembly protein PilO
MKPKQFFLVLLGVFAVLVLVAGAGYYFGLKQLQSKAATLSMGLASQAEADKRIETLDEALPRDKKQTEILAQLQLIASQSGLQITSVSMPSPLGLPTSVSQTVKSGTVLGLPINFQLSGTYAQLQEFTARVENLNRFTNITNLAISRPDKTKPVVYSISLIAYIKP